MSFEKLMNAAKMGDIEGVTKGMNDLEKEMSKKINLKSESVYFIKDEVFLPNKKSVEIVYYDLNGRLNIDTTSGNSFILDKYTLDQVIDMVK